MSVPCSTSVIGFIISGSASYGDSMSTITIPPSLKSASGAGFTFEDKVTAYLLCEMLIGRGSLDTRFGVTQKLERQASDWEPFGDLRLTVTNNAGNLVKCGGSVKSNRQVTSNGCSADLCAGLWAVMSKQVFVRGEDALALFCATFAQEVHQHLNSLCRQAQEVDPVRLDEKVVHAGVRKIYDSFRNPQDSGSTGLPGHVLGHFIPRTFDFEDSASRDEAEAVRTCRELLVPAEATDQNASDIWAELLRISETLRTTGGEITREKLVARLRPKFKLRDDSSDVPAWARIRSFSETCLNEIDTALPDGFTVPRASELEALRAKLATGQVLAVLGDTGSGKSALMKMLGLEFSQAGSELVFIKAEKFNSLVESLPDFAKVLSRTRKSAGLLIFDALEGCYNPQASMLIADTIRLLAENPETPWRCSVICQTPEWPRALAGIRKHLGKNVLPVVPVEIAEFGDDEFEIVCSRQPAVARLAKQPHLVHVLKLPKMLDILLSGQLAENRLLASEADLLDWWWEQQVRGANAISSEERVARLLASRMADELCTELSPDSVADGENAANTLVRHRVLSITSEGRIRFRHDLLSDWSRVKHLLSLGDEVTAFMRKHAENPPWLRAMRLLSQYLLDRSSNVPRWRAILQECAGGTEEKGTSAENLQIVDAWLEGIAFSGNAAEMLATMKEDLFGQEGRLLRRFLVRLLHVGTIPDPIVQERYRELDPSLVESASRYHRLPLVPVWGPVLQFLVNNQNETTELAAEELAEIGIMWARLEEYFQRPWRVLAELILLNAEKELRREVAGVWRSRRDSRASRREDNARITIYTAGLLAGSQFPDRAIKLALKAAGRADWEKDDLVASKYEIEWMGQWYGPRQPVFVPGRRYVQASTPSAWPDGPTRRISRDFAKAWIDSGASLAIFQQRPELACEATLAFLLAWPKQEIHPYASDLAIKHAGFSEVASFRLFLPFWTKGPFYSFLKNSWQPALKMIVRLINFATERYADWWPYEPAVSEIRFDTPTGTVSWKGTHQVYWWHHYHMNTVEVVTCALMALEKWFDDRIAAGESVSEAVQVLFSEGRSWAFAGVLITLGKRHPKLFLNELRPLLFVLRFYNLDLQATMQSHVGNYSAQDSRVLKKLRQEWNNLPGRSTWLLNRCCEWFLKMPEFGPVLEEVGASWKKQAMELPAGSEERLILLRWASNFDRATWKLRAAPGGGEFWVQERPEELRDLKGEKANAERQWLLTLPFNCEEKLKSRKELTRQEAQEILATLRTWKPVEQHGKNDDDFGSAILDPRNARVALLATLLCLGRNWLQQHPAEYQWSVAEVRALLASPPKDFAFSEEDSQPNAEAFLARCAVQCWSDEPGNPKWRLAVGRFVTAYRYFTIRSLFQEACHRRAALGGAFQELQALALSCAAVRAKANHQVYGTPDTSLIEQWAKKWLREFAAGKGPLWQDDWSGFEIASEVSGNQPERNRKVKSTERQNYRLDPGVIVAAFANLPPLAEAADDSERIKWLHIAKELLNTFLRTLPASSEAGEDDESYNVWTPDEKIFDSVAARVLEGTPDERRVLWKPILSLPDSAHHYISRFIQAVYLASLKTDPPMIGPLLSVWQEMVDFLFSIPERASGKSRASVDIWKHVFLYGTPFTCIGDEVFIPFIEALRTAFGLHVKSHLRDVHDQSAFLNFVTTKAGERILVDALTWLLPSWEAANSWFWKKAAESSGFSAALNHGWRNHFPEIRKTPESLKAFKLLTLKLAAEQVPIALEVQSEIGTTQSPT
jgi:hypothetical protein